MRSCDEGRTRVSAPNTHISKSVIYIRGKEAFKLLSVFCSFPCVLEVWNPRARARARVEILRGFFSCLRISHSVAMDRKRGRPDGPFNGNGGAKKFRPGLPFLSSLPIYAFFFVAHKDSKSYLLGHKTLRFLSIWLCYRNLDSLSIFITLPFQTPKAPASLRTLDSVLHLCSCSCYFPDVLVSSSSFTAWDACLFS